MELFHPLVRLSVLAVAFGSMSVAGKAQLSMADDSTKNFQTVPSAVRPAPADGGATGIDYGDAKSSTLTTKAWNAFNGKNYEIAKAYAEKCIDLYQNDALKMQGDLSGKPTKDQATELWALNDVGTCYLILGKTLDAQSNKQDAIEVYNYLVNNLKYAEAYDPKGWYWFPADAARKRLSELK